MKNQLLIKIGNSESDPKIREYFLDLVEKNKQLHMKANYLLANKNTILQSKANPLAIKRLQ